MTPRKHCLQYTAGLIQIWDPGHWDNTHKIRSSSTQTKSPQEVKVDTKSYHLPEVICEWYQLRKERISFLQWSDTIWSINHTLGPVQCPGIVDRHKMDSMLLLFMCILFGLIIFHLFYLFVLILLSLWILWFHDWVHFRHLQLVCWMGTCSLFVILRAGEQSPKASNS